MVADRVSEDVVWTRGTAHSSMNGDEPANASSGVLVCGDLPGRVRSEPRVLLEIQAFDHVPGCVAGYRCAGTSVFTTDKM